jgi:hypothetical protein
MNEHPLSSPSRVRAEGLLASLETALKYAYKGDAEHGAFSRLGMGEYVPSPFLTLNQLRQQVALLDAAAQERERLEAWSQRFEQLLNLPKDWDSYGADPLDTPTVERAKQFMERVSVVPCVDGGVQLEWHTHGLDMEIEFEPDGKTLVYAKAVNDTCEVESAPPAATREEQG